jgi:hypothetical protein
MFERIPIRCSGSVEQPVAGIADQRFDFLNVQAITFDSDAENVSLIVSADYFMLCSYIRTDEWNQSQ